MTTAELPAIATGWRQAAALDHGGERDRDEVASLFAVGRRSDGGLARSAGGRTRAFDPRASATSWIVAEGLGLLDDVARQRVLDGWRWHVRGRGGCVVVDCGCDVRVDRVALGPGARAALLHWLPFSMLELALFEGGLFADEPLRALALLLRPPTIWSAEDARLAERRFPRGPRFEPERFAALEQYAAGLVAPAHVTLVRRGAGRISAQLPFPRFGTASSTVAAGCAALEDDDARCAGLAARQLARFASSAAVLRL